MNQQAQRDIFRKLKVLNHAKYTGNVSVFSLACPLGRKINHSVKFFYTFVSCNISKIK